MTKKETDIQLLKREIEHFTKLKQIIIGAECCSELMRDYEAFHNEENWGDPTRLETVISESLLVAQGKSSASTLTNSLNQAEEVIPDTEDFGSLNGCLALNAGVAVCALADLVLDKGEDAIGEIVDSYLESPRSRVIAEKGYLSITEEANEEIEKHPKIKDAVSKLKRKIGRLNDL